MRELTARAERIAALLKSRKETVAVAESSAGGLITAALLDVPGGGLPVGDRAERLDPGTLKTGSADRVANMHAFAAAALALLEENLAATG